MGQAADTWGRLRDLLVSGRLDAVVKLYDADALYLEPYNPPHRGNLLITAYLKDYFGGKTDVAVEEKRVIESAEGTSLAVEWLLSYDAAGRRWNQLPRASFFELGEDGLVTYHRDYT